MNGKAPGRIQSLILLLDRNRDMKVYIVRERFEYHNDGPDDRTRVFADPTKAMQAMASMYDSALGMLDPDQDDPDFQSGFEAEAKYAWFITPKEDCYDIWVEECEVEE